MTNGQETNIKRKEETEQTEDQRPEPKEVQEEIDFGFPSRPGFG